MHPGVAAWLKACASWGVAVATKEHMIQIKRRKLCKDHGIPLTKVMDTNGTIVAAMEQVRRKLCEQMQKIRLRCQLQDL